MDDDNVNVPDGMVDVHTALESLHIISNMIGEVMKFSKGLDY